MEGRRKPKFGKIDFQICQNFLKEKQTFFGHECPFNGTYFVPQSGHSTVARANEVRGH